MVVVICEWSIVFENNVQAAINPTFNLADNDNILLDFFHFSMCATEPAFYI